MIGEVDAPELGRERFGSGKIEACRCASPLQKIDSVPLLGKRQRLAKYVVKADVEQGVSYPGTVTNRHLSYCASGLFTKPEVWRVMRPRLLADGHRL